MFEFEAEKDERSKLKRQAFGPTSASAAAGLALWTLRKPRLVEATASKETPQGVTIVLFSDAGERLETARVPKVVKSEEEWRKQLTPNAFDITRHADTEFAYSGKNRGLHHKGLYRCICCADEAWEVGHRVPLRRPSTVVLRPRSRRLRPPRPSGPRRAGDRRPGPRRHLRQGIASALAGELDRRRSSCPPWTGWRSAATRPTPQRRRPGQARVRIRRHRVCGARRHR